MRTITFITFLAFITTANAETSIQDIKMQTNNYQTFYVNSSIEGAGTTSLLVDTGAGYSTITEDTLEVLRKTGNAVYVKKLEGIMADGSRRVVSVYRISGMSLGGNCRVRNIEVAVFPAGSREILGLSALGKVAPFTFSMDPPVLSLSNCNRA